MLLAFEVLNSPEVVVGDFRKLSSYISSVNNRLGVGTASLFLSGKVSIRKPSHGAFIFVNVRYWLFDISLLGVIFSWSFKRGLMQSGYGGSLRRLSGVELSKLLERYL